MTRLFAILTALCALMAIVLGAVVTSLTRPIAATQAHAPPSAVVFEHWHIVAGVAAVVMTTALALLVRSQSGRYGLLAGALAASTGFGHYSAILHAVLSQVFFGCIVAVAVMTTDSWKRGPEPIDDTWRPSLRSLSIAVPAVILLQTTLGASYRYHAMGVLWHILNAMITLLLILIVAVFMTRQFPQHSTLKPAATALAIITSIQVLLGFTTLMMLIIIPNEGDPAVVITSVLHVATGALTFGAGVALSILIPYHVRKTNNLPANHN